MKKKLFAVLVMVMVLLTACGGSKDDGIEREIDTTVDIQSEPADELETEGNKEAEPEDATNEDESKTVESETTEDGKQDEEVSDLENYETFEEAYYNDPDIRAGIEGSYASMGNEEMSVGIDIKVNNFIVTYKFLDSSETVDGMADALAEALEERADTLKSAAAAFDEALGFEEGTCTVTVIYADPDDNVLVEKTFKND